MSVIAYYVRLSSEALEQLREDRSWAQSLFSGKIQGAEVIDVDKACNGLVWLLSRVPAPPPVPSEGSGFVLMQSLGSRLQGEGGSNEPTLRAGYGPARSLTIPQVREFSEWLSGITPDLLRSRFDWKRMADEGVYPDIWMEGKEEAFTAYLIPYFLALQQFFARAAAAHQHVLVFFN